MDDISLTVEQINFMKSALGFHRNKITHSKFVPLRNIFSVSEPYPQWEDLVNRGLAERASGSNITNYSVSVEGERVLGIILDIKIN